MASNSEGYQDGWKDFGLFSVLCHNVNSATSSNRCLFVPDSQICRVSVCLSEEWETLGELQWHDKTKQTHSLWLHDACKWIDLHYITHTHTSMYSPLLNKKLKPVNSSGPLCTLQTYWHKSTHPSAARCCSLWNAEWITVLIIIPPHWWVCWGWFWCRWSLLHFA